MEYEVRFYFARGKMEELIKKVLNVIKRTFYKGRQNVFIKRLSSLAMKWKFKR